MQKEKVKVGNLSKIKINGWHSEPKLTWIDQEDLSESLSIQRRLFVKAVRGIYENFVSELENPNNLNFRRQTLERKVKYIVQQK